MLTPTYVGIENRRSETRQHAANDTGVVCPVKIPLPDLMREVARSSLTNSCGHSPSARRCDMGFLVVRPKLYAFATRSARWANGWGTGSIDSCAAAGAGGWTKGGIYQRRGGRFRRWLRAAKKSDGAPCLTCRPDSFGLGIVTHRQLGHRNKSGCDKTWNDRTHERPPIRTT